MVEVGTGGRGTRFINTNYPNEDGLTAGTTKQTGHKESLEPQEKSFVSDRERTGGV